MHIKVSVPATPPSASAAATMVMAVIRPGKTFVYSFPVKQSGTYWYHSHSGFQEQAGLYGSIVIAPKNGERVRADREHVVLLSDWTDSKPESLFRKLKQMSYFFNFKQPTAVDFSAT